MLKENPQKRPNIYEVVREACQMQGKKVPIRDVSFQTSSMSDKNVLILAQIYSNRSVSEARKYQELPPTPTEAPAIGATFSAPVQETQIIPEIAPMRRGRPGKTQSSAHSSARPSPSPFRAGSKDSASDPFAALDGKKAADAFSNRFPSLDQFDILHEKGGKFDFEPAVKETKSEDEDLSRRLTNALADDAFVRRPSPERQEPSVASGRSQASPVRSPNPQEVSVRQSVPLYQPTPKKPAMVSTGTMTSPSQTPRLQEPKLSTRPIYRFPPSDEQRPSSQPRTEEESRKGPSPPLPRLRPETSPRLSSDQVTSQTNSTRPSMETLRRPSGLEAKDLVGRSKSAIAKGRPVSVQPGTRYGLPRDSVTSRSSLDLSQHYEDGAPLRSTRTEVDRDTEQANLSSELDYLRAKEEEESNRKREKRSSGGHKHSKRGSLSSLSFSGGKNLLAGRFGEAFRRFESSNQDKPPTPSTEDHPQQRASLISNSDALDTAEDPSYEIADLDDIDRDDISPEMRRELERRRLSQEEKRVANAAAEYRRRVADNEGGGPAGGDGPRSSAIQNRVQSLLGESNKPPPPPKTASGYGRYTDNAALPAKQNDTQPRTPGSQPISRTPGPVYGAGTMAPLDRREGASVRAGLPQPVNLTSTGYSSTSRPASRPTAPPKPKNLRVGTQDTARPTTGQDRSPSFQATPATPGDDWEANFSRRFPSLSGLEMETEIELPKHPKLRTREV